MLYERSSVFEFTSIVRPLEGPGAVTGTKTYLFDFGSDVEKTHESYDGINVRCRRARPRGRQGRARAAAAGAISCSAAAPLAQVLPSDQHRAAVQQQHDSISWLLLISGLRRILKT